MPVFEHNGKKYNVQDAHLEKFKSLYPDASAIMERDGKKYRVKIGDYGAFTQGVEADMPVPTAPVEPLTTFGEGVKQGADQLWQGAKYAAGEWSRLTDGAQRDYQSALKYLDAPDFNAAEFDLDKALEDEARARFEKEYADYRQDIARRRKDREDMGFFDRIKHKLADPEMPTMKDTRALGPANMQYQKPLILLRDALEAADGDIEKARAMLAEKAGTEQWSDKATREASQALAQHKPVEGWAWWGQLVPQTAGQVAALGATAIPGVGQYVGPALAYATTAGLTLSSAGAAMNEARQAGATDEEVFKAGLIQAIIEYGSEKIPLDRLMGRVGAATFKKGYKDAVGDVVEGELEKLLTEANKKLGGKLLSGKTAKALIKDMGVEGASEFIAEGLGTFVPIIYEDPENYPTLKEAILNGWEGAKAGIAMGGFLGGGSMILTNKANDARRKHQGGVVLADSNEHGVVEVISPVDASGDVEVLTQMGEVIKIADKDLAGKSKFTYDEWKSGELDAEINRTERAYQEGYEVSDEEKVKVKDTYDTERARAEQLFDEATLQGLDNDPVGTLAGLNDVDRVEAVAYVNAKTRYEGMIARVQDDMEDRAEAAEAEVQSHANRGDGMIHPVTMQKDDRKVYVVSGNVVGFDDGTVDKGSSDKSIIVCDAQTGKLEFVSAGDIAHVDAVIDTEQEKQVVRGQIMSEFSQGEAGKIEGTLPFNVGDAYPIIYGETAVDAEVLAVNGDNVILSIGEQEVQTTREEVQAMNKRARMAQIGAQSAARTAPAVNETQAPVAPQPVQQPIPTEKRGKNERKAYHLVPVERTLEELEANELSLEEKVQFAQANIDEINNDIKAVDKQKPTMGTDIQAYKTAKQQWQSTRDDLQARLDYYNALMGRLQKVDNATQQATNEMQPVSEGVTEEHPSVAAANSGRDTVGGSPVALAYLLEGGQGSILNAGYFLHGVAAAFPAVSNEIETLRGAMSEDVLGMSPTDFVAQRADEIAQIGELITNAYGEAGAAIYNELLNNASGFVPRVGAEVGARIEALQPLNESTISQTSDQVGDQVVDRYTLNSAGNSTQMQKDMEALRKSNREEYSKIQPAYELLKQAKERGLYPNELEELRAIVKGTSLEGKVDGWFTPVMAEGGNAPGQSGVPINDVERVSEVVGGVEIKHLSLPSGDMSVEELSALQKENDKLLAESAKEFAEKNNVSEQEANIFVRTAINPDERLGERRSLQINKANTATQFLEEFENGFRNTIIVDGGYISEAYANGEKIQNSINLRTKDADMEAFLKRMMAENLPQKGIGGEPVQTEGDAPGDGGVGRSLSQEEAQVFINEMEANAEVAPEIELTIENWDSLFGEDGLVETPIGEVKMGENQFTKLMRQGRDGKLGMVKPTLENPDAIIEDESKAKNGETERPSSYVFVKSFKKADGSRYYYFTSVTVSKDGKEVIVSNQEKRRNAIANLLTNGKLVWKHADNVSNASDVANGLYSSQGNLSDLAAEGTDAPQTNIGVKGTSSEGGVSSISHTAGAAPAISLESRGDVVSNSTESSASEDSNSVSNKQENTQKSEDVKEVSEETTQAEDEVAAFDKQAKIAEEREKRADVAPRPGHLAVAIGEGNEKAVEEWKAKFDSYLQKLNADDLPAIDATIKGMQGRKKDIRTMNKDGYKDNSNYKAYDYIEKVLKKRAAELKKVSATEQPKQENKPVESEPIKDEAPVTSETIESESKQEVEKIEDVGEVLAGARKDALKVLASSFENATVKSLIELPFSKAFKKPDLKKAVESGALREEDALFYEAMFNALINSSKPKNSARHRNAVETWAEETYNSLQLIKSFVEADEAARDRAMAEALEDKFPAREEELAVIEKRKVWNARNNAEWGDKTTPNPVWVAHEVLKVLGYKPGDKVEIPFGVLKANVFATGYEFYNKKGERLIMQSVPTVEEGIENIVWLSKTKRGDADTMHPVSSFFATPTKRDMGDSGRYYVLWGTVRNPRRSEFGSIEEANAFAAGHKEAVVRPIQEVVKRYGYKLTFREPLTGDKFFVNDMEFETEGEAMQYLEDNYDTVNEQTNELLAKERGEAKKEVSADDLLEVAVVRGKEGWKYAVNIKGKYANNMGMPLLLREFDTREDAKAFLNESKNEVFEIYKKQQAEQKKFVFFDTGENSRIGEDYRGGRDVTAKDFMDTFGFRGVQFGNWTNQEDRQMAVNQAFDAFMDLAKLLGVSPKALSLNGELGMAFGSRGSGFGNAHYEPGEIVINLTKTRGAGSLAHEWWHALDNYFARRANVPMGMVTDSRSIDMRPELRQAYNELLKMIEKSDFYKRSKAKGDYWGRMHEVTARLMAEWVDQSLKDRGELNTFLSRGVNEERYKRMNYDVHRAVALIKGKEALSYEEFEKTPEALAGFPYPSRAELKEFGDAMRNIFETVEEQETEEGDVVLYRSAERAGRKINKHAEEFNKTHKGGVPVADIDPNNIDAELAEEGFTAEEIQELKERIKKGVAAVYNTDKKIIYLLVPSQDKESVYSTCWHEDTHAAIDFLGLTPEMMDEFYSFARGKKKEAFEAFLDKIGYEIEEYPEESLAYGVQAMHILDNWGAETLSKLFGSTAEGAQRQMEIIQPLIDYINNGRQGTQSSVGENVRDRGMYNNTANQKKTAETEGTGASETATGGLTESEIALLEASTGYTREEIIDMFGYDLNRSGAGPLTDREVVMESDPYSKVLGKPRYYGKRQREFVARQRRRMAEKARQVAEKLNLDNVEVLESTEGLTGKKATSKGWFDPRTGKITVVVPNHGSTGDIVETVLHEAVAHYGLRKLFGENFKNFLDNVYRNVTPEIRAEITELAKKHGWDFHTATEEYLASLAENTNFERINPSLWSNIKSFFMKMLAKVGITLDEPLGDNELRYILWRSHQNLVNPGWFNVFGQAEDIAKQYELKVGDYADNGNMDTEGGQAAENSLRFREAPGSAAATYNNAVRRPNKSGSVSIFENVPHRMREAYQDSMLALKTLQEAISAETGKTVADNENAYMAENRMSSTNKAMVEVYARDFMAPLMGEIDSLLKSGATMEEITNYLFAKHGIERNAYMRRKQAEEAALKDLGEAPTEMEAREAYDENLKELTDAYVKKFAKRDYSGLTALTETGNAVDAEEGAQDLVDEFERLHDTKPLWKAINNATKETLRLNFVSGLIDRATYDHVRTMFDYYIPLRGWDETVAADEFEYLTSNRPMLSPALQSMHGRQTLADNPIATIGHMAESAIVQGNRNIMKQKFLGFVMNNPTSLASVSEQWYVLDNASNEWIPNNPEIPLEATPEQVVRIVEEHEARMLEMEREGTATRKRAGLKVGLRTSKAEGQEHTVTVKRNGKEYNIYINGNPRAAQAVNGLTNPETMNGFWARLAQMVKNFMSRAFTSMNPAFIGVNLTRDLIWSATAIAVKEDAAYSKLYRNNLATSLAKAQLPILLSKFKAGTLDMNNDVERYFNEFMLNGGETGFTQINTVDDYKRSIKRFVKEAQKGVGITKRGWRAFWNGVEFLNRSAEDTTRFMTYMTSRQMGRSVAKSIWDAKEVTVNFNKKGSGGMGARFMNFAYIFFNAAVQSVANFGKLMYHHPGKTMAALGVYSGLGMLMPLLNAAMIAAMGGDEEDYWSLPDWVRRNNIVIFAPWTDEGFITIPLPHELRPFYGMGEAAYSALVGKQEVEDAIGDVALGFSGLLPVDFTGNAGSVVVNFTPTFVQPFAQLMANTDYFGKPIYKDNGFNELDPEWTKAYKGTNSALVAATKWLNELTGGDEVKSGVIDWNPAQIEHLIESYTGGLGKTANKFLKTLSMLWDDDMREWKNVPAFSSFYQKADERTEDRRLNEAYYKALDEAELVQHDFNGYRKQLRRGNLEFEDELTELMATPEFDRYLIVNEYDKIIGKLYQALKGYEESLTDEQIEQINENIRVLKAEMLEKVKAAGK